MNIISQQYFGRPTLRILCCFGWWLAELEAKLQTAWHGHGSSRTADIYQARRCHTDGLFFPLTPSCRDWVSGNCFTTLVDVIGTFSCELQVPTLRFFVCQTHRGNFAAFWVAQRMTETRTTCPHLGNTAGTILYLQEL